VLFNALKVVNFALKENVKIHIINYLLFVLFLLRDFCS